MDTNDFNAVIEGQFDKSRATLIKKATEYAADNDRLHNFKVAAKLQGITARAALAGMLAKHTVSVFDLLMAEDLASPEMWDEKMGDSINYHLLALAVIEEERRGQQPQQMPLEDWAKELLRADPTDLYTKPHIYFLSADKEVDHSIGRVVVAATPNQAHIYEAGGYKKYTGNLSVAELAEHLDLIASRQEQFVTREDAALENKKISPGTYWKRGEETRDIAESREIEWAVDNGWVRISDLPETPLVTITPPLETGYYLSPLLDKRVKAQTLKTAEALLRDGWSFDTNQKDD